MSIFDRFREDMPKQKSEEELKKRFDEIKLEKWDLPAMLIAALITFGPLVLGISLVYIIIAKFFGMA